MIDRVSIRRSATPHGEYRVLHGSVEETLADTPDNTFDAAFGDPPYDVPKIGHHTKDGWVDYVRWKPGTTDRQWSEIARTCKQGAPVLTYSFGGAKLFEQIARMTSAGIDFVGVIPWLFNQAFPKGLAVGMQLDKRQIEVATRFECPNGGWRDMRATDRYVPVTPDGIRWEPYETTVRQMWNPVLVGCVGGGDWYDLTCLHGKKAPTRERADTDHPNVKPVIVNREIAIRILEQVNDNGTDGPSRLLVPWSGVGSEIAGAVAAGWDDVTGIEIDEEYVECSRTRVPLLLEKF